MIYITDDEVLDEVIADVRKSKLTNIIVYTQNSIVESIVLQVNIAEALIKKGYKVKSHGGRRFLQVIDTGAHIHFRNFEEFDEVEQAHQLAGMEFQSMVSNRVPSDYHEIPRCSGWNYVKSRVRI